MKRDKSKKLKVAVLLFMLLFGLFGMISFNHSERTKASANSTIYNYYENSVYNSGPFLCPGCKNRYKLGYSSFNGNPTIHFEFVEKGEGAKDNLEHVTKGFSYGACFLDITCSYAGGSNSYVLGFHQTSNGNTDIYSYSVYRRDVKATSVYCADHQWTCKKCNSTDYELSCQRNQSYLTKHNFGWKKSSTRIHKEVCTICAYETGKMEACQSFTTSVEEATGSYCKDTKYTCKDCLGYYYEKTNSTSRTTHNITNIERLEPTCTTAGHTAGKRCSKCDYVVTASEEIAALGHSYKETKTNATCTSGGSTFYKCTRCENSYTGNVTSALGHSYTTKKIAATCTKEGYTNHTCMRCGSSYKDNTVRSLGHNLTTKKTITCTDEFTISSCSRCSYSQTNRTGEGSGHQYESVSVKASSCTEGGHTVFRCSACGVTYQGDETDPLGHDYIINEGENCRSGKLSYTCSRCGETYTEILTEGTEHDYLVSVVPPTCTDGGYTLHKCSRCTENFRDEETPALGHRFSTERKPSTCTEFGKNVSTCQVCGFIKEESDGTYPTGHSFTSTVTVPPTCTTEGVRKSVCEYCGEVEEHRIAAKGHHYEITDFDDSGDTTVRTYTCSECNESYTQELGDQYVQVTNYVEYLFDEYSPYMFWVLLATAGLWSIAMGIAIIVAVRNDEKAKAKKMLVNYLIGLVVIAAIVVACPYLIRGIASLVS